MDIFDSRYFQVNKLVLSCIGQWTYQTAGKKRLARTLVFLSLSTAIIPQVNYLFSIWGDVDATLECLTPFLIVLVSFCQMSVFTYNEEKLVSLVNSIKRDWKFWSSGKELEILQAHAEKGRFYTLLFAGNVYTAVFMFVSMSLTPIVLDICVPLNETRPKQMVYAVKFPLNQDKYFHWILIHGSLTSFYNMSILFSCEAMVAVTTQHVCGLFAIISYRLKNTVELSKNRRNSQGEFTIDRIYKEMTSCIDWHNRAFKYAKTLESCFSPFLFFTIGLKVIMLSLLGIQTLNAIESPDKIIKFGAFMTSCLIQLYSINLPAQNLLDRSIEVTKNAYEGYWYLTPNKSKKLLVLIIGRGQIPCKLTAGKMCTLDMVSFSTLLKTSVSYFTVLSSLRY